MTNLITIARLELVSAARLKWIRLLTIAFALLAVAAAYSAGAAVELSGADGFARTTMALMPVTLILIPLAALVLGVSGQAAEAGNEPFLFGQPVGRAAVLVGRWMGELIALGGAIVAGFGLGGVVVSMSAGSEGVVSFIAFIGLSVVIAAIFLSIAAGIAAATEKRVAALGIGTFVWFAFVLLYDAVALSAAGYLTGPRGGRLLFASVFANPTDLVRVAMLLVGGTANVLGAAGEAWTRWLGGGVRAAAAAGVALVLWTVVPLAVGVRLLRARDL